MSVENAIKVLKEVQNARDTLEENIFEVCRKHEQIRLYPYLEGQDQDLGNEENEVFRIKREVNDKIRKINDEIHDEVYNKKKPGIEQRGKILPDKNKIYGSKHIPRQAAQRPVNDKLKFQNTKPTKTKVKTKTKVGKTKDNRGPPPESSTAYDELVLRLLYGQQSDQAQRHTIKVGQKKPVSQSKLNESKIVASPKNDISQSKTLEVENKPKNDNCNHPEYLHEKSADDLNVSVPKALEEPTHDLSPKVAKTSEKQISEKRVKQKKELSRAAGPNVAVIHIKADDDTIVQGNKKQSRIREKIRERYRKSKLNIQPLPNVDIDTTDPSSFSSLDSSQSSLTGINISKNKTVVSPDVSKDYNFQEFINVKDLSRKDVDISQSDADLDETVQQPQISLTGCKASFDNAYQGPSFPPQHIPNKIVEKVVTVNPTLEKSAQDWLEKELLARLVTQMVDNQNVIPSSYEHARNVETVSSDIEESDHSSYTWIEQVIGLQGIQFFVDAGIPVNEELIRSLLRSVILEYLETLFGHPAPIKSQSPLPTVVEKEEIRVPTPIATPLPSPCISEKKENHVTPNQTVSELSDQILDENINEEMVNDIVEEDNIEYEIVKTPDISIVEVENYHLLENIATPDATIREESSRSVFQDLQTPRSQKTASELPQFPMADFEPTEMIDSIPQTPVIEEKNDTVDEICVTPLPVVLSVVKSSPPTKSPSTKSPSTKSPSLPSTTVTMSSSTTVGLSTFEEISSGEFLNAESVISEASEGELKLVGHYNSWNFVDESMNDSHVTKSNTKRHLFPPLPPRTIEKQLHNRVKSRNSTYLSEGEINQMSFRPLKSIGEVSDSMINQSQQTDIDLDDLEEDNDLEDDEVKIDPMEKILHKINSPPASKSFGELIDRSEGEITPYVLNLECKQSMIDEKEESLHEQSISEIISKTSLNNSDILNEESDAVFPSHDVSNSNQEPNNSNSRIITVQPRVEPENVDNDEYVDIIKKRLSNDENFTKSEGEFLQDDLSVLSEPEEKEKVIMVLRLPDMDDEQVLSDEEDNDSIEEEFTTDGISSISGL